MHKPQWWQYQDILNQLFDLSFFFCCLNERKFVPEKRNFVTMGTLVRQKLSVTIEWEKKSHTQFDSNIPQRFNSFCFLHIHK